MKTLSSLEGKILSAGLAAATGLSLFRPADNFTWLMESFPILIAYPLVFLTRKKFPLTPLVYRLLFLHALILLLGAHYTYALVPLGEWMKEIFGFSRNHYDRIGHLAQGFVPAIVARELLLRKTPLKKSGWLFFLVVSICLSISAMYEFLEWGTALATGEAADAFLGTQGDPWDTQWDMFLAFNGAILSQIFLSKLHDSELELD